MAWVLHPRRAFQAQQMQMLPLEIVQAAAMEQVGIDPAQIEDAIILAAINVTDRGPEPSPAIILRFAEKYDRQIVLERLAASADKVDDGEQPIYRLHGGPGFCVCLADEKTVLGAPEDMLRQMVTVKDASSPLIERLRTLDTTTLATGVVVVEQLRPLIQMGIAGLPPLPPPLQELTTVPKHLAVVEIHFGLEPQTITSVVLEGINEASAAKLEEILERGIEMGLETIDAQVDGNLVMNDSATGRASAQYMKRIARSMVAAIQRDRDGKRLTVRMEGAGAGMYATSGILVALLLPAVQAAREAARRSQAMNNLKQIGLAFHNYADVYQHFPAATVLGPDGKTPHSWRVAILPYIDGQALYGQYKFDEPWDSENNRKLISQMPAVFREPGADPASSFSSYYVLTGEATIFGVKTGAKFADIIDGTSNTILAVEAKRDIPWTKPEDIAYDPAKPLPELGGWRLNGYNALFADGSVRFISESIDEMTLRALFTRAGGEAIGDF
jgi:prepilin-type processing-associated H-X9-DG protein